MSTQRVPGIPEWMDDFSYYDAVTYISLTVYMKYLAFISLAMILMRLRDENQNP